MGIKDDAVEVRAQGWRTLAALHGLIEAELERSLQAEAQLSVVEYTVLDALSRQDGWHMRMQQLARATALSASATTRLVNRLEDRGLLTRILCADDRRGIYTELTPSGITLLEQAGRSMTPRWSGRWPRPRRCRTGPAGGRPPPAARRRLAPRSAARRRGRKAPPRRPGRGLWGLFCVWQATAWRQLLEVVLAGLPGSCPWFPGRTSRRRRWPQRPARRRRRRCWRCRSPPRSCGKPKPIRKFTVHSTNARGPHAEAADLQREDLGEHQPGHRGNGALLEGQERDGQGQDHDSRGRCPPEESARTRRSAAAPSWCRSGR